MKKVTALVVLSLVLLLLPVSGWGGDTQWFHIAIYERSGVTPCSACTNSAWNSHHPDMMVFGWYQSKYEQWKKDHPGWGMVQRDTFGTRQCEDNWYLEHWTDKPALARAMLRGEMRLIERYEYPPHPRCIVIDREPQILDFRDKEAGYQIRIERIYEGEEFTIPEGWEYLDTVVGGYSHCGPRQTGGVIRAYIILRRRVEE